ncbi:D-aminoacylase [Pontiella desulfatans]|uniref:D-aminoacylase n=1 Tax=Pontiella desulfatans TaxID=2750659 RepID=A0A6C2U641_PONDE|nr:D-aminoacylase [Pontiella desulfatans]VGO14894.1 D-aminoacylase [Pontiella desulfatans]
MDFEIKISDGKILDGSGNIASHCDIGINNGRITKMGELSAASAEKTVHASGLTVCPGFIDTHSHSDTYLLLEPSAASKVYQGITTEICGNCGASAAPLNGDYKMPSDWLDKDYSALPSKHTCASVLGKGAPPWKTVSDYRALYEAVKPAINAALLVGHNTLHAGICGYEPRAASVNEQKRMERALEQALAEGAIGLSSGLAYPPGSAVPREEIIELAKVVVKYDGLYTTHMRSESSELLEAIDESIQIAEHAGARLQISHLKASGTSNWNKIDSAFEMIRNAQKRIPIGSDRYPYTAGSTDLDICLPKWATYGGRPAILERLRTPAVREKIREELLENPPGHWDNVMVGSTQFEEFKGHYLPEVAKALEMNEVDAFLRLIDADDLKTGGIFFGLSEENLWRVLAEPYVSIGSDGSMRAPWGPLSTDHPHPRSYGSHTRFLRAALDGKTVPLPEAIRKMTSLPAEQFGLKRRGLLKEGYAADILVFDPEEIRENATYAKPHQLSGGMRHVFVNGVHALDGGNPTSHHGGSFIARAR